MDFYRRLSEEAKLLLKEGGLLALEIGYDQGSEVVALLEDKGYNNVQSFKDLAGKDRVVLGFM